MPEWNAETAEWYAKNYGEYATNRLAIDAVKELNPTAVLDIGCGTAAALRHANSLWPKAKLVGVDPVPRMVEIAAERLKGQPQASAIELLVGSAERLPVGSEAFDLVLLFDTLDHWKDVPAGALEVRRVLSGGGHVVVVKDQGVPAADDPAFDVFAKVSALQRIESRTISADDVEFALSVFRRS